MIYLRETQPCMVQETYMPAEMVAREGAIGRSIFLVFSGVIKVMLPRPVRARRLSLWHDQPFGKHA